MAATVLEARARFGGRASSQRHGRLFLNQGPHALYLAGAALRELRALGIDPPGWNRAAGRLYIHDGELRRDLGTSDALRRWLASAAVPSTGGVPDVDWRSVEPIRHAPAGATPSRRRRAPWRPRR